jgi:hypothetical protein
MNKRPGWCFSIYKGEASEGVQLRCSEMVFFFFELDQPSYGLRKLLHFDAEMLRL